MRDLKGALLTYDRVTLIDPDDRDLFPQTGFILAMGMPPVVSLPFPNPVRTLGKTENYDRDFDQLMDAASRAVTQGALTVVRTYQPPDPQMIIGMADTGGFPLDFKTLLWMFRAMAGDEAFQRAAIEGDEWLFAHPDRIWQIARQRGSADGSINNSGILPDVTFAVSNEAHREPLSNIARARLGHTIKLVGYAMTQGLIPHGSHRHHDRILRQILQNGAKVIDQVAEVDPFWNYRNRALGLVHDEYLDLSRLDDLSVNDVLSLRTSAWGRQAEARDKLLEATGALARASLDEPDFDKAVAERIRTYRQMAAEVEDEREALHFRIVCEAGKAILGTAGATATGALTSLGTGVGVAAAVLGGAYFALEQFQDLRPLSDQLKRSEEEYAGDFRLGIHNFFDRFP